MVSRQFAFEALEHGAHHVLSAFQHGIDICVNFRFDIVVLADVTVEFNFHGAKRYRNAALRQDFSTERRWAVEFELAAIGEGLGSRQVHSPSTPTLSPEERETGWASSWRTCIVLA